MINNKTTVYYPDKAIRQGYISLFREMTNEVVTSRWLTWQLFRRNFISIYKQSVLGIFWALFIPLVSVGTFIFLNQGGIFDVGDVSIPYPLYAVAGIALWQLISTGLTLGANSIVNAGAMITHINFTRASLVISSVAQGFLPSVVQIVIVFILFAVYGIVPPWTVLLVPFAVIPLMLLTLGLAYILSLVNAVVRDAGNGISILITFLMFLTPVLYAKPDSGMVAAVSRYNPLYYLVAVPRDLLTTGSTGESPGFFYSSLIAVVVFLVCWIVFHLIETRIVERV
jgi:lipopolysaccharide transport system permease protein